MFVDFVKNTITVKYVFDFSFDKYNVMAHFVGLISNYTLTNF